MAARSTFVWGLKRGGIHLVADWLYANHGGTAKNPFPPGDLRKKLADGFCDSARGVAFFNNCGRFNCRNFGLGDLRQRDFEAAAAPYAAVIFGIEDCSLRFAPRIPRNAGSSTVLVLRDPLNNLASRLAGRNGVELFRVDEAYVDLFESYCAEFLGQTNHLPNKTVISYNQFVADRSYRNAIAAQLDLPNVDAVSDVSAYGGGSSFTGTAGPSPLAALLARYRQHPIPRTLVDLLLERPAIVEACSVVFGFDLAARAGAG